MSEKRLEKLVGMVLPGAAVHEPQGQYFRSQYGQGRLGIIGSQSWLLVEVSLSKTLNP